MFTDSFEKTADRSVATAFGAAPIPFISPLAAAATADEGRGFQAGLGAVAGTYLGKSLGELVGEAIDPSPKPIWTSPGKPRLTLLPDLKDHKKLYQSYKGSIRSKTSLALAAKLALMIAGGGLGTYLAHGRERGERNV